MVNIWNCLIKFQIYETISLSLDEQYNNNKKNEENKYKVQNSVFDLFTPPG
jgi:hypothetical protein